MNFSSSAWIWSGRWVRLREQGHLHKSTYIKPGSCSSSPVFPAHSLCSFQRRSRIWHKRMLPYGNGWAARKWRVPQASRLRSYCSCSHSWNSCRRRTSGMISRGWGQGTGAKGHPSVCLSPDTPGWRAAGKMSGCAAWSWSGRSLSCNNGTKH